MEHSYSPLNSSAKSLNLGEHYDALKALGGSSPKEAEMEGRTVSTEYRKEKVGEVAEKICKSISEVNKMQFIGFDGADKHKVKRKIRKDGGELRNLKKLLNSKGDEQKLKELAGRIQNAYPEDNLSDKEALGIAEKLQKITLQLPSSLSERLWNNLLTAHPGVVCVGVGEAVGLVLAGALGALWKVNLDPGTRLNPSPAITDPKRPPVLRVHGLIDTQGSSLPLWGMMKMRRQLRELQGKENVKYGSGYSLSYAGLFYNNPKQTVDDYVDAVADKVIAIRAQTGHNKIIMQGHSQGGLIINRFAQLQDAGEKIKLLQAGEQRAAVTALRIELKIKPKIHGDVLELAQKLAKLQNPNSGETKIIKDEIMQKLSSKVAEFDENDQKRIGKMIDEILAEGDLENRNKIAEELANSATDLWLTALLRKINPDPDTGGKSMEAKWLISICTPYDGSKFATFLTNALAMARLPRFRVIDDLNKRSDMTESIGTDAREKVGLGERKVYNIACKTSDQFVSEGSATVNYDSRYKEVYKTQGHLGVLFSPRVANTIGGWLDEIYQELAQEQQNSL